MAYESQKIKIKGTNKYDVACALAELAGFKGYVVKGRSPSEHCPPANINEIIVFDPDTIAQDPEDFLLLAPAIIVSKFPKDEYLIEFNDKVDSSLVEGIEEKIRSVYASMLEEIGVKTEEDMEKFLFVLRKHGYKG